MACTKVISKQEPVSLGAFLVPSGNKDDKEEQSAGEQEQQGASYAQSDNHVVCAKNAGTVLRTGNEAMIDTICQANNLVVSDEESKIHCSDAPIADQLPAACDVIRIVDTASSVSHEVILSEPVRRKKVWLGPAYHKQLPLNPKDPNQKVEQGERSESEYSENSYDASDLEENPTPKSEEHGYYYHSVCGVSRQLFLLSKGYF